MEKAKERKIVFRSGEKVNLRPVEEEDAPLFAKWINDEETTRYTLARFPMNIRDEKKWIENISKNKESKIILGIETKDGVLIGNISLNIGPVKDRRGVSWNNHRGIKIPKQWLWHRRYKNHTPLCIF